MPQAGVPDVFEYLDVRSFLRDYYTAKKKAGRGFSYRAFSRRAGLSSPNHLKRVIDGDRRLTPQMADVYAQVLGLSGEHAVYFSELAAFSGAKTTAARSRAFERLTSFRRVRQGHELELAHAAYHSRWYVPAIREMMVRPDFSEDPSWIAQQLLPPIRVSEAVEALEILEQLGLVERDEDGRLVQREAVLSTGAETRGMHIAAYHRAMIERASDAIDLVHRDERDISSLTFAADDAMLSEIKQRIQAFRKELIGVLSKNPSGERVIQLNFQLFPLSKSPERTES